MTSSWFWVDKSYGYKWDGFSVVSTDTSHNVGVVEGADVIGLRVTTVDIGEDMGDKVNVVDDMEGIWMWLVVDDAVLGWATNFR